MGCGSCGTTGGCAPAGCKSNGNCSTGGCNAINSYDWLGAMVLPEDFKPFGIIEIKFKGKRTIFARNSNDLELYRGDLVKLKTEGGYDIGTVGLSGELVKLQLKKYGVEEDSAEMATIDSKISNDEYEKYLEHKSKETTILEQARTIALELKLAMKLSDIDVRGDGRRVIFFYTAENRVDFRELIKRYAQDFKMRIEMRQIGYREEAQRLGGIGSCGRELCCTTWLTSFNQVSTQAARYQNLSINMLKLSGQCGKLKCCLNYELDTYLDALSKFPKSKRVKLETEIGSALSVKVDILKQQMWFAYEKQSNWVVLSVERVNEIIALNKKGQKVPALKDETGEPEMFNRPIAKIEVDDLIEETSLESLDNKLKNKRGNNKPKKKNFNKKPGFKAKNNSSNPGSNAGKPRNPNYKGKNKGPKPPPKKD